MNYENELHAICQRYRHKLESLTHNDGNTLSFVLSSVKPLPWFATCVKNCADIINRHEGYNKITNLDFEDDLIKVTMSL